MTIASSVHAGRNSSISREVPARVSRSILDDLGFACVFAGTVLSYIFWVLPQVLSELARWRARAAEISDPHLRRAAQQGCRKRGNIEGAALFGTLAPPANRHAAVRALVAFQTAYNYVDALSELPSQDPVANADQLHQALLGALHLEAAHLDYYAEAPHREDAGYLVAMLDACRDALVELPSYPTVAPMAREAAARIVDFQALNLAEHRGGHTDLERWAKRSTLAESDIEWWETAAAAGSSLAVHALVAAAAEPDVKSSEAGDVGLAYFPSLGALHSLLDSLVDRDEDQGFGQRSLLDYYHSPTHAAINLTRLAMRGRSATDRLRNRGRHRVILTAMCSYYLSAPQSGTAEGDAIAGGLTQALGAPLRIAILMFRSKRVLHKLTDRTYS